MKALLGYLAAAIITLCFATAYGFAIRPGAGWLDAQWLYLVALPYTWTMLQAFGAVDFSPDAPGQVAMAWLVEALAGLLLGAAIQAILRGVYLSARRFAVKLRS